jgi:Tfp pilus assembly protein PilF
MKKLSIVTILLVVLVAAFALPAFAQDSCNPSLDYLTVGHEQLEVEDFNGALYSANCGLTFNSKSYEFYMLRADIYCHTGNTDASVEDFTRAIELHPNSAHAYNYRGWAHYMHGHFNDAMADVNRAIALDTELAYAYNNRGLIWQAMGFPELARSDFEQAIELGFEQTWADTNLYNVNFEIEHLHQQ